MRNQDGPRKADQARGLGSGQDVTLPDAALREQLGISRQQWQFARSQDPERAPSSHPSPAVANLAQAVPAVAPGSEASPVDFVAWCGSVLRALFAMQESTPSLAAVGVRLDELARAIFGEAEDVNTLLTTSTRGQALADVHRDLAALGMMEDVAGNHFRIPRQQRERARDQTALWRAIGTERLDPAEERLLLALNRRSERRAADHAFLEPVAYAELYSAIGLDGADAYEARHRVDQILSDLETMGLARRSPGIGDASARATYSGLAWETRRQVLASDGGAPAQPRMEVDPIWAGRNFPIDARLCFVLLPFRPPFDVIYADHIKPTVEQLPLDCRRADDIYGVRPIMDDIWEQLCRSRIVIADLTGRNPNVFYEVGIAHTLGKPVVLLTQTLEDVPFDLRHHRVIVYEHTPRGAQRLEESIERTLRSVLVIPPLK